MSNHPDTGRPDPLEVLTDRERKHVQDGPMYLRIVIRSLCERLQDAERIARHGRDVIRVAERDYLSRLDALAERCERTRQALVDARHALSSAAERLDYLQTVGLDDPDYAHTIVADVHGDILKACADTQQDGEE